jgi:hypothetical protein
MITVRRSDQRGHANYGWLDTYHTFSFNDYYDVNQMGFRTLRVINEDRVAPGGEFSTHPHRDMEIITYILDGELTHKDSMGNGSVIRRGEVQRMSAGSGVMHSEANKSGTASVHLFQIWILPDQRGLKPEYEQIAYTENDRKNRLCLVASPNGAEGSLKIHQNVRLFSSILDAGHQLSYELPSSRHAWIQVADGELLFGGQQLKAGDGASVSQEESLTISAVKPTEFLFFDLA